MAVADTATVKEDTNTLADPNPVTGNVLTNDTDVDVGDTHSVTAVNGVAGNVDVDVAGLYGTLHLKADGSYSYTLDNTKASVQALAEGVTVTDTFSYTNSDNHSGTSSANLVITVTGTNDAPVLDATKTPVLVAENQGVGAPSGAVGTLVSSLVSLSGGVANVTDVDSGAVTGIALTNVDSAHGTWFYSVNGGSTWLSVGVVTNTSALLLAADANTRLYFQPTASYSGTDIGAITFRAWDQTSGSVGSSANTTSNGGTTAFSTVTDTANITIIDTTPPAAATITSVTDDMLPVTGTYTTTGVTTNDADLTVKITLPTSGSPALAGDTIHLYNGTGTSSPLGSVYTLTAADITNGFANIQTGTLTNGTTYDLTARITDAASNQSLVSNTFTVTEDTAAPNAPVISNFALDTGVLGDHITSDKNLLLSGTAEAGSTVTIYDGATLITTALADNSGNWSVHTGALPDALHNFTAMATDTAGNTGTASAVFSVTIDTTAPAAPSVTAITTDSGTVGDHITNDTTLTISGTAEANSTVTVFQDGVSIGTALADGSGNWSKADSNVLVNGTTYQFTATATDAAGNTGVLSASYAATIDTTAPAVSSEAITSATGIQNSTLNAGDVVHVTVTFGEAVTVSVSGGTPQLALTIGGTTVQANYVSGSGGTALVFDYTILAGQTDSNGISINLNAMSLNGGTITDLAGNNATLAAAAVTDNANFKVDTTAPTVSSEAITSATGIQNSTLNAGDVVHVTVTFGEAVTVSVSGGTPQLALTIGGTTVQANYVSGSGGTALVFDYTILAGQTDSNGISINLNAMSLNGGTITDLAGNNATLAAAAVTDNANFKVDTTAPTVTVSSTALANPIGSTSTITFTFSEAPVGFDLTAGASNTDITATRGTLGAISATGNPLVFTATFTRTNNGAASVDVKGNSYTDAAGNLGAAGSSGTLPAGVAGEQIHLALSDPSPGHLGLVTLHISGVPSDWLLNAGIKNADGSWTVETNDPSSLTVTTLANFAGAAALEVNMGWTNADGSTGTKYLADNVEVFAAGAPIYAESADDTLTGSSGADLFVFGQPIAHDTLHNFDAAADKIDLIGFDGVNGFADLVITDDGLGNAIVTIGAGETINVLGVSAAELGSSNFIFNAEPTTENAGTMTIGDGAIMPLGGIIDNTGTIELNGGGQGAELEVIVNGMTLQGGGHLVLTDDANNLIIGGSAVAAFTNVDNTISGAGELGGGLMTLANAGTIVADGTHVLEINTGATAITNSGLLEASGSGGLVIDSALFNSGSIWANCGNVVLHGDVTGGGTATVSGVAELELGGNAALNVSFADANAQTLQFDGVHQFTGTVTGMGLGDSLDFKAFDGAATLSYAANADGLGGVLTVVEGVDTIHVDLEGTYTEQAFTTSYDLEHGLVVKYDDALLI